MNSDQQKFRVADPDPYPDWIRIPYPDPDPQPWIIVDLNSFARTWEPCLTQFVGIMFLLIEYIGWMEILPIKNKPEPKIFSYFFLLVQCSPCQQSCFLIWHKLGVKSLCDERLLSKRVRCKFLRRGTCCKFFKIQKKMYPAIICGGGDSPVASECWNNLLDKFI